MGRSLCFALCLIAAAAAPASAQLANPGPAGYDDEASDFGIPPHHNIHVGAPHAPTPLTVPGARTITTVELYNRMMARQSMLLLYVNGTGSGNENSIAGAYWLPDAGFGTSFNDKIQAQLQRKVDDLTHGDKNAAVVVFCFDAHCWLSYNAALRLAKLGYRNVFWYRGGREAWKAAGLPVQALSRTPW